jgi:hypothetical protein
MRNWASSREATRVEPQQPLCLGLEERAGHLPQGRQPAVGSGGCACAGGQSSKQLAQCARGGPVGLAHQGQGLGFDLGAQRRVGRARRGAGIDVDDTPLPVVRPQVGRVNAIGAGQFLHRAVLREQCQRRNRLVGQ